MTATRARTDPRITRRRKAIERSRKKRFLGSLVTVAIIVVIVWAAFWSPLLHVHMVRVSGSQHVTPAEVERVAGIGSGTNLLLLSTSRVVHAVEGLPWVRRARVERSLPGTVRVRILERHPALQLSVGSSHWLIDSSGYVIAAAHGGHKQLPTIAGVHVPQVRPGLRLTSAAGAGALRAWRSLPPELAGQVVAVFAPTVDAITMSLKDGTTVRYGGPQNLRDKNRVLLALLHKTVVEGTGASYIDVRVPTSPAVAPVVTPTPAASTSTTASPTASPSSSASPSPSST
ncbi:MAG: cell division protein FtsQ [Actinomycetota bacterium]|nr:cell division protein FtsQ [Actinomycetota bacterium]